MAGALAGAATPVGAVTNRAGSAPIGSHPLSPAGRPLPDAALSAESGQNAARLNELLTALQSGDMACTCLFKDDVFPIIRFSTHDVSAFRADQSPMGLTLRRIAGFQGRSDNMVKLRGINIYPTGLRVILTESDPQPLHA